MSDFKYVFEKDVEHLKNLVDKNAPIVLKKPTFVSMKEMQPGMRVNMHLKVEKVEELDERGQALCLVGD